MGEGQRHAWWEHEEEKEAQVVCDWRCKQEMERKWRSNPLPLYSSACWSSSCNLDMVSITSFIPLSSFKLSPGLCSRSLLLI